MIPLVDLTTQYHGIKEEVDAAIQSVLESGQFILGPAVSSFEQGVAAYLGVRHAVGVASGTDALLLALRALGIGAGDEVLVPAYTFFATASTVMLVGAKPVFVDIDPVTYEIDVQKIEARITARTRAIMPVHLYGHPADMEPIMQISGSHGLKVIEDNAQAFGASYKGQKTGSIGDIGCLSYFPTKNLGAYGDGGMVVTNDPQIAERVRMLRTHGWKKKYHSEEVGYNSRLHALQAAILSVKLPHVDAWNSERRRLAREYNKLLAFPGLVLPVERPWGEHVYHLYILRTAQRDQMQAFLKQSGIASEVYYPLPPHLSTPCRALGYKEGDYPCAEQASRETMALPLYPELSDSQQNQVISVIGEFLKQ